MSSQHGSNKDEQRYHLSKFGSSSTTNESVNQVSLCGRTQSKFLGTLKSSKETQTKLIPKSNEFCSLKNGLSLKFCRVSTGNSSGSRALVSVPKIDFKSVYSSCGDKKRLSTRRHVSTHISMSKLGSILSLRLENREQEPSHRAGLRIYSPRLKVNVANKISYHDKLKMPHLESSAEASKAGCKESSSRTISRRLTLRSSSCTVGALRNNSPKGPKVELIVPNLQPELDQACLSVPEIVVTHAELPDSTVKRSLLVLPNLKVRSNESLESAENMQMLGDIQTKELSSSEMWNINDSNTSLRLLKATFSSSSIRMV